MKKQEAFTLVEVMVAMSIFLIVTSMMMPAFTMHLKVNTNSEIRNGAIAVGQQMLDGIRSQDPGTLPSSGTSALVNYNGGERTYQGQYTYCAISSYCTTRSRHLKVRVLYKNQEVFNAETVFTRLK